MKYVFCFLLSICFLSCYAQYYFYNDDYYDAPVVWEIGVSAGGMNCLTDLGGRKGLNDRFGADIRWRDTRFTTGGYAAIMLHSMVGLRLEVATGQVQASDSSLGNDAVAWHGRYLRNLSFRSPIREIALTIEFHPLAVPGVLNNGPPWLSPYVFAGCGFFRFDPRASLGGASISLHQLHTEGQGFAEYPGTKQYSLTQWNIPMGIGLRYELSATTAVRAEGSYRKLFTDYLDDVSTRYIHPALFHQELDGNIAGLAAALADRSLRRDASFSTGSGSTRGNDKNKDAYFSFTVKFAVVLGRKRR